MKLTLFTTPQFILNYLLTKFVKEKEQIAVIQGENTEERTIETSNVITRAGVIDTEIKKEKYQLSTMGLDTDSKENVFDIKKLSEELDFKEGLEGKVALINAKNTFQRAVQTNIANQRRFVRSTSGKEAFNHITIDDTPLKTEQTTSQKNNFLFENAKKYLRDIQETIQRIIPAEYFKLGVNLKKTNEITYLKDHMTKKSFRNDVRVGLNIEGTFFQKKTNYNKSILGTGINTEKDLETFARNSKKELTSFVQTLNKETFEPNDVNYVPIIVDSSVLANIISKKLILDRLANEELIVDDVWQKINSYKLGLKILPEHINIKDKVQLEATHNYSAIKLKIDDEGIESNDYKVIDKGVLVERPSSRIINSSVNKNLRSNGRAYLHKSGPFSIFEPIFANIVVEIDKPRFKNAHKFCQSIDSEYLIGMNNLRTIEYLEEENMFTLEGLFYKFNIKTHQDDSEITHKKNTFSRLRDLNYSVETYSLFNNIIAVSEKPKTHLFKTDTEVLYSVTIPDIILKAGTGDLNKTRSNYVIVPELTE